MKISGSADSQFPIDLFFGLLWSGDEAKEIPLKRPFAGRWGAVASTHILDDEDDEIPERIDLVYLSLVERKFYSLEAPLDRETAKSALAQYDISHLVVGMGPKGLVSVWMRGNKKSVLVNVFKAESVKVTMREFRPDLQDMALDAYCNLFSRDLDAETMLLEEDMRIFSKCMRQYCYRYVPIFGDKQDGHRTESPREPSKAETDVWIEEALCDGTFDELRQSGLMNFHQGGKPEKISLGWRQRRAEYSLHIWLEKKFTSEIFEKFYGAHANTKSDFIIRIDVSKNSYELALFRTGLKQPIAISKEAYQMILFKNKFEYYRSDNYDKPTGAWFW